MQDVVQPMIIAAAFNGLDILRRFETQMVERSRLISLQIGQGS